ncbi:MAG: transposase [bacterium]|nr:transposase [bacterium]
MARRISFVVGEYYHLYNRGVEKRKIFLSSRDYDRFVALLYLCNGSQPVLIRDLKMPLSEVFAIDRGAPLVDIGAWCLMPNHFHLLVRQRVGNGISIFMQKLATAYTMYFNTKNKRSGVLFQGVFKAVHTDKNRHLKYLFAYIHLNPLKLIDPEWRDSGVANRPAALDFIEQYQYSSYPEYAGKRRRAAAVLERDSFPKYFPNEVDFVSDIFSWLSFG